MKQIYLDHAATTPMAKEVVEVMTQSMLENFGNPSSIHLFGRKAKAALMTARKSIAQSLNASPKEIIFTSGGTEGDNTALISTAFAYEKNGRHIITTAVEHPAVLEPMKYLESLGFEVTYLPVNNKGQITPQQVKKALREDTILVSIMAANNETGNLFPLKAIGEILKDHPAIFHTDAVQAYGMLFLDVKELGVDLLSVSAHKFNGPKGVGFLYKKETLLLPAFLKGGHQEDKHRAGTENLAGIVGMAKAVELLPLEKKQAELEKMQHFNTTILTALEKSGIEFSLNGDETAKLPHILNLHFHGIPKDVLLMRLDLKGIAVSSGSACTAGTIEVSHVLEAMYGKNHPAQQESLRISLGVENTSEEIETFLEILIEEIHKIQKISV